MGHATLSPYLTLMGSQDERGEVAHAVQPARHQAADAIALSSAAWDLARTTVAVCQAQGLADRAPTLALSQELHDSQAASDAPDTPRATGAAGRKPVTPARQGRPP